MALQSISSANKFIEFENEFLREYYRENRFSPYVGRSLGSIIVSKQADTGTIRMPIIFNMTGEGVANSEVLGGNEESLTDYYMDVKPKIRRHGWVAGEEELYETKIDLASAAREFLMIWGQETQKFDTIRAMMQIQAGGVFYDYGVANKRGYPAASGANLDTWNTNNQDRILYGVAKSNLSAGNHTTSLGNIDTTNDKLSASMVSLAKRMAANASPKIRPYRVSGMKERYIMFHDSYAFRNLKRDAEITQAQREVQGRGAPLFEDGEIDYEGIVHIEINEIADLIDGTTGANGGKWGTYAAADGLNTAGNGSSRVGVSFLCGQQAASYPQKRMPKFPTKKEDDYDHFKGIGISCFYQMQKYFFNNKQHGMVTVFSSAAVDA